jgi:iron complex outermembrane receptor protein
VQYGAQNGNWSSYFAAQGLTDDGWRQKSPAKLGRIPSGGGWASPPDDFM